MSIDISYETYSSYNGMKYAYANDGTDIANRNFQVIYVYIYIYIFITA